MATTKRTRPSSTSREGHQQQQRTPTYPPANTPARTPAHPRAHTLSHAPAHTLTHTPAHTTAPMSVHMPAHAHVYPPAYPSANPAASPAPNPSANHSANPPTYPSAYPYAYPSAQPSYHSVQPTTAYPSAQQAGYPSGHRPGYAHSPTHPIHHSPPLSTSPSLPPQFSPPRTGSQIYPHAPTSHSTLSPRIAHLITSPDPHSPGSENGSHRPALPPITEMMSVPRTPHRPMPALPPPPLTREMSGFLPAPLAFPEQSNPQHGQQILRPLQAPIFSLLSPPPPARQDLPPILPNLPRVVTGPGGPNGLSGPSGPNSPSVPRAPSLPHALSPPPASSRPAPLPEFTRPAPRKFYRIQDNSNSPSEPSSPTHQAQGQEPDHSTGTDMVPFSYPSQLPPGQEPLPALTRPQSSTGPQSVEADDASSDDADLVSAHHELQDTKFLMYMSNISRVSRTLYDFAEAWIKVGIQAPASANALDVIPGHTEMENMLGDSEYLNRSVELIRQTTYRIEARERARRAANGTGEPADDTSRNSRFSEPELKRRRGRATNPGKCHSCNRVDTPEWRRGPDGARTLCNACGLHFAKLERKKANNAEPGTVSRM